MPYTAPDRPTLRSAIARDLRDPVFQTFTSQEIDDLINLSLVEVTRIYPKEDVQELTVASDKQRIYVTDAQNIFRVEVILDSEVIRGVIGNDHDSTGEGGWDLHAGSLYLPKFAAGDLVADDSPTIRIWGYFPRELMTDDSDILDGDAETEFAVRTYSVLNGYQRLQNDRILFQQWLTNTGNTDVSPNQLSQLADLYQSQWETMRNRLRRVQRV